MVSMIFTQVFPLTAFASTTRVKFEQKKDYAKTMLKLVSKADDFEHLEEMITSVYERLFDKLRDSKVGNRRAARKLVLSIARSYRGKQKEIYLERVGVAALHAKLESIILKGKNIELRDAKAYLSAISSVDEERRLIKKIKAENSRLKNQWEKKGGILGLEQDLRARVNVLAMNPNVDDQLYKGQYEQVDLYYSSPWENPLLWPFLLLSLLFVPFLKDLKLSDFY